MATFITYRNVSGKPVTLYHKTGMKTYTCEPNEEMQYRVGDDGETKGVKYGRVTLRDTKGYELVPHSMLKDPSVFKPVREFSNVYLMLEDYYLLFWDSATNTFKSYQETGNQQYYIHKNEKITLLVARNDKTNFFELKKDPISGNCIQVDFYAGKNAWMPIYGLTEHAMPITQFLHDMGEAIGIGGDFEFSPSAVEDGYGIEMPLTLPEVKHEVLDIPLPVKAPAAKPLEVKIVEVPVPVKKASTLNSENEIPTWAKIAYVSGMPLGFIYAAKKDSGALGFIGWGLLGSLVSSLPYNYYANNNNIYKFKYVAG